MIKKVNNTKNKKMLEKLINSLLKSPIKSIPETITRNIPSTNVIRETIREIPRNIINDNLSTTKEKYNRMKNKYNDLLIKYQDGSISSEDLFEMYILTSDFGRDINSLLPSRQEIANMYQTMKSRMNYYKNYINNNLLNQRDRLNNLPPRAPPAPPPTAPEPEPEPDQPSPSPDPPPPPPPLSQGPPPIDPLTNPINLQTSYLADNLPLLSLAGLATGIASTAAYNLFKRNSRPNSVVPALRTDTRIDRELARLNIDQSIAQSRTPRRSALESNRLTRNILEAEELDSPLDETEDLLLSMPTLQANQIPEYNENLDPLFN
jgi:hypothetical protein